MKRIWVSISLLSACAALAVETSSVQRDGWFDLNKNGRKDVYEDNTQSVEQRVADLMSQMTLDEKIGQLQQLLRETDGVQKWGAHVRRGAVGSFLGGGEYIETPMLRNGLQRIAVEEARLGIPLIFGHDSIHGFRTIFPIPLAMACAWDPDLFERCQTISARETAAVGIDWTFAPMVDLARDPRWGRIAEGFGEDPWLGTIYAAACVRGFQGTNPAAPDRLVACMKHYAGYGAAEGGRDYNTTEISEYTLRNFYLPQFKAGVDAGVWTFMSGFNMLPGAGASGHRHLLTEILRDEWKFPGMVISDWTSVEELIPHGVAADGFEAARLALNAGVDMEMVSTNYQTTLRQQLKDGTVTQATIDEAVRRVLTVKFVKGLFDRPFVDETLYRTTFLKPDALALAREAATRSCVLLKNDNGVLPLSREVKKIALLGPLGDDGGELLGCWAARGDYRDAVSIANGLRQRLGSGVQLTVVKGCELVPGAKVTARLDGTKVVEGTVVDSNSVAQAVAAAKEADTVILALGEPRSWSGEDANRSTLGVTGRQQELFDAVVATGKPVIVVLIAGRPLAIPQIAEEAAAVLLAWHPGVQGGPGIADVLFGAAEPGGRLTTSFPRAVGQVPVHYNHYNTGRPTMGKYADGSRDPLFPFGFGLTYGAFEYDKVQLSSASVRTGEPLIARVRVKNSGQRPGTEVVQLYIRDIAASAGPRAVRELKGFQKVRLTPGEARSVEFKIGPAELGYYDAQGRWLVEPGKFQLWIAKDAASGEAAGFELVK